MARACFQVLVIPFVQRGEEILYGVFSRSDMDAWQFVSGGGEDAETPIQAAKREFWEETGLKGQPFYPLESRCSIPAGIFPAEYRANWDENCFVVPEFAFGVRLEQEKLTLSHEHREYRWVDYDTAWKLLRYDSNRTAMFELRERIARGRLAEI